MTDKDVKLVPNREPIFETEKVIIENIEIEAAQKCDK